MRRILRPFKTSEERPSLRVLEETYRCDVCGKIFKDEKSLKIHKTKAHSSTNLPSSVPQTVTPLPSDAVIGKTVNFEDYVYFQNTEGTASDLESLVTLEKAWAKYESRMFRTSKAMTYVLAVVVLVIGLAVGLYIAKSLGVLPI